MELISKQSIKLSEAYDRKRLNVKPDWKAARKSTYLSLLVFAGSILLIEVGNKLNVWEVSEGVRLTDIIGYALGVSFLLAIPKFFQEQKEIADKQTSSNKRSYLQHVIVPAVKSSGIPKFEDCHADYFSYSLLETGNCGTWARISRDSDLGYIFNFDLDGDQLLITWSRETSELTLSK